MARKSEPVPCLNCGKNVKEDYPLYVTAAFAGICGSCEREAIAAEREKSSLSDSELKIANRISS